jgi:hypothetical protein
MFFIFDDTLYAPLQIAFVLFATKLPVNEPVKKQKMNEAGKMYPEGQ